MAWILIAASLGGMLIALPFVRRACARLAHDYRRRTLRRRREELLNEDGAPTMELPELTLLVDRCLPCGVPDPFELDALLDRYAELALARYRCGRLVARADLDGLETRLAISRTAHPRSAAMIERRIAHTVQLARRGRRLDESLSEVGELVHYYVERCLY